MRTIKLNTEATEGHQSEAVGKRGRWYRIEDVEVDSPEIIGMVTVEVYSKRRGYTSPVGLILTPRDAIKLGEALMWSAKAQMRRARGLT